MSMYNDDGDDEMEDVEEDEEEEGMLGDQQEDAAGNASVENLAAYSDRMMVADSSNEVAGYSSTPTEKSSTPQLNRLFSPPLEQQRVVSLDTRISRSATLTIVDYGHEEGAMSPEPEVLSISLSVFYSVESDIL